MSKKKTTDNNTEKEGNEKKQCCALCGRPAKFCNQLFEGLDGLLVCDDCIEYAHDIIEDSKLRQTEIEEKVKQQFYLKELFKKCPKPKQLKEMLDQYVIGQDDAKMTIATAAYNHYKRIAQDKIDDVDIEKSSILMIGASGTGKTMILKSLGKILGIPVIIVDATKYTEAGYVGEDVESILSAAFQASDYDIPTTETCIIAIDEGDKLGRKSENPSITRDVSGEGVQQGLLKIIEGSKVRIAPQGGRKHPEMPMVEIDTTNILFVFMGAFDGIEKRVASRLNTNSVGFKTGNGPVDKIDRNNLLQYVTHDDAKAYGIIPELLGRLPILTTLQDLDKDALIKILNEPKNAIIKQYEKIFEMDEIKLSFDEDVYELIADKALSCGLGARSLRTIVEVILKDAMYNLPGSKIKKLRVTKEYAEERINNSALIKAQELTKNYKKAI